MSPYNTETTLTLSGNPDNTAGPISYEIRSNLDDTTWGDLNIRKPGFFDPPDAVDNSDFIGVACTLTTCAGIKSDGTVDAWGNEDDYQLSIIGELGDQAERSWQANPVDNHDIIDIRASRFHFVGLRSDGTVLAWGQNWVSNISGPNA